VGKLLVSEIRICLSKETGDFIVQFTLFSLESQRVLLGVIYQLQNWRIKSSLSGVSAKRLWRLIRQNPEL